mgnify:CR=1 FL=1
MAANNIRKFKRFKDDDVYGIVAKGKKKSTKKTTNRSKLASTKGANNIRRFKDSDHETYYTGTFRLGDDGKLIPVMGIKKAKANNIRRLKDSGHQTVIDDNDPKRLKIIKQFRPRA